MTKNQLLELTELASQAAKDAGDYILTEYDKHHVVHKKVGSSVASSVFTVVDIEAQRRILEYILPSCKKYQLGLLTEEAEDDKGRLEKEYFWAVDPLDGSLPFIEGREGFSVSIALVSHKGEPLIGVVYDPLTKELYTAFRGGGVKLNGDSFSSVKIGKEEQILCDASYLSEPQGGMVSNFLDGIEEKKISMHCYGGAVMNAIQVIKGQSILYFKQPKDKGGSIWDYAATACIAKEMGGIYAVDIYGAEFALNRPDGTYMNHKGIVYTGDQRYIKIPLLINAGKMDKVKDLLVTKETK